MTEVLTCDTPETRGSSTEELELPQYNYNYSVQLCE